MDPKPLSFSKLTGISEKTMSIHHDKLYAGYVAKANEVNEKLTSLASGKGDLSTANPTFSELRALRDGETFATNGAYLHEAYFGVLGGDGKPEGKIVDDLIATFGAWENFVNYFSASGMAMRGWLVLCWDTNVERLRVFGCDAHNQGGVWGCLPILVLDVYEHAYFIDYGSDRKSYIADWWKNLDWKAVDALYQKAVR
ncbi:MAG: Fe-Mn family superoxide dismutase [bacterium]|nr:Fe-Mn family superoxide dismutase [bacterium]